jgi:MoxR-like ATPase
MLTGVDRRDVIARIMPLLEADEVMRLRQLVQEVRASDALVTYVQELMAESRRHPGIRVGLSPRAGLALLRGARALALLRGRDFVLPEDVQALFVETAAHRLVPEAEAGERETLANAILTAVPVD